MVWSGSIEQPSLQPKVFYCRLSPVSQIWLNFSCGWSPTHLHHKFETRKHHITLPPANPLFWGIKENHVIFRLKDWEGGGAGGGVEKITLTYRSQRQVFVIWWPLMIIFTSPNSLLCYMKLYLHPNNSLKVSGPSASGSAQVSRSIPYKLTHLSESRDELPLITVIAYLVRKIPSISVLTGPFNKEHVQEILHPY